MDRIVVFDLGNVLIRYEPGRALSALSRRARCSSWKARWALGRAGIGRLATGGLDPARFVAEVNRRLGTNLTHEQLRDLWGLDLPGPVERMLDLLARVQAATHVALLSDTNAFHWEYVTIHYPVLARIGDAFLSFREGVTKPDLRFFRRADLRLRSGAQMIIRGGDVAGGLARAGAGHGRGEWRILYFDDRLGNVRAARKFGWEASVFKGSRATERALRDAGIIS